MYLMRNNLLGELARSVENIELNATDNDAAANQHLDLTMRQRAALEKVIDTSRARDAQNAPAENELNLTSFDWTLDDGSNVTGLGKEISDIYKGPDALSNYLINRLQTQLPQVRAETLPTLPYNKKDDMVDIFEELAVTVHR